MLPTIKVRISRGKAQKLQKLLHMKYKPSEIARELGITTDLIYRSFLPAGAPCEKDAKGNVWIVGDIFAKWAIDCALTNDRKPAKVKLLPGQVYCLRCNQIVEIKNPRKSRPNARGVINLSGLCPVCAAKVNRFCSQAEFRGVYERP